MTRRIYPHGTADRYKYNACRCADCRAANTETHRRRRRAIAYGRWEGQVDATGTIRRLRALTAIGWSCKRVADIRGVEASVVRDVARGDHPKILGSIAREYALIYDELCTSDGPQKRSVTLARQKGWHGPEAWTDETIDDPDAEPFSVEVFDEEAVRKAVNGQFAYRRLGDAERIEAYRRLTAAGATPAAIRARLRINQTVFAVLARQAATDSGQEAA